jgi:hypothetical protein
MKNQYIETDPILILSRERSYNIHKFKLAAAGKTINNSTPTLANLRSLSKSPLKHSELDESNSRIYNKLNKIYHRPVKLAYIPDGSRSYSSIKRLNEKSKIEAENFVFSKRLTKQKATLSFKSLQKQFNESKEIKQMISKFKKLKSNKKLIETYKAKALILNYN